MAKLFKDAFTPIEIDIESIKGEKFTIQSKFVSADNTNEFERFSKNYIEKKIDITNTDYIYKMMTLRFGNDDNFWSQFSTDLLKDVADYYSDEAKKKSSIKAN
jgi:hypothetical protein